MPVFYRSLHGTVKLFSRYDCRLNSVGHGADRPCDPYPISSWPITHAFYCLSNLLRKDCLVRIFVHFGEQVSLFRRTQNPDMEIAGGEDQNGLRFPISRQVFRRKKE